MRELIDWLLDNPNRVVRREDADGKKYIVLRELNADPQKEIFCACLIPDDEQKIYQNYICPMAIAMLRETN